MTYDYGVARHHGCATSGHLYERRGDRYFCQVCPRVSLHADHSAGVTLLDLSEAHKEAVVSGRAPGI